MSKNRVVGVLAYAYVYFFRGTPLLAQVFLVYYGLGSFRPELEAVGLWWFFRDAWNCAVFAFTLNTAAYQAEILRGAIESVPAGQTEGGLALGLHKWVILRKIIMPQALIVAPEASTLISYPSGPVFALKRRCIPPAGCADSGFTTGRDGPAASPMTSARKAPIRWASLSPSGT